MEKFIKSLIKEATADEFDAHIIEEDLDLDIINYDDLYEVVFENDNYKICKPTAAEGMIPLASGTRWIGGASTWNTNRKTGYDEIDFDESHVLQNWEDYYVILDKHNDKKKWMFKDGYGDIYVPSFARYPCATWVAENGDEKMWRWFLDKKFPYISTNLDKKVGAKMIQDKTVFRYPDDLANLTYYNKRGSNITSVEFAPGTTKIKANAFSGLKNVKEIVVPEGVTVISSNAFSNCGVEKIVLPSTVKTIGKQAFYYCKALKEINLPEGLTKVGEYLFYADTALEKMPVWPKGLTMIPDYCFAYTGITEFVIPDHIKSIGNGAFDNLHIKNIIIPSSVESIGRNAFAGRLAEYAYVPSSVKFMDQYAFGSCYRWDRNVPNPTLVIDCEVSEKPDGWDNAWDCFDRTENARFSGSWTDWDNPNRWIYRRYKVNWGISAPRKQVNEDLEVVSDLQVPGLLNAEQCDKLLDLIVSLPEMAENDKERWDFINKNWILNIWIANDTPSKLKVDSYINSLSDPSIYHILGYWASAGEGRGPNYMLRRFKSVDYTLGGDYNYEDRVDKYHDICVSSAFVKDFLHMDVADVEPETKTLINEEEEWVDEDLDLDVVDMDSFKVYDDNYWTVYKPQTTSEFEMLAAGTTWSDSIHGRDDGGEDWHFTYYNSAPLFIIENKVTGERFLYNTRESWSSIRTENGDRWEPSQRHGWHHRSAGNNLSNFLSEQENADGLIRWAIRKWPQGLDTLKAQVQADDLLKKNNGVIIYNSELYNKIKAVSRYYQSSAEEKKLAAVKNTVKVIQFPRNIQRIEGHAFDEWKGLEEVIIPNSVKYIGEDAFAECENLKRVVLPNKLQYLGEYAFSRCPNLSGELKIPATCSHVGEGIAMYTKIDKFICDFESQPDSWSNRWNVEGRNSSRPEANDPKIPVEWLSDKTNKE